MKKQMWILQVICIIMLFWALNPKNPYAYYTLLRWVCCGIFAYLSFQAFEQKKQGWVWLLGIMALLYNPIFPVHLNRELWSVVNVVTIGIAVASIFAFKVKKKENNILPIAEGDSCVENIIQIESPKKENWFLKRIRKYQVITFTFGFIIIYRLSLSLMIYFADKNLFTERSGMNIWFFIVGIPTIYFLLWLLVIWVASKYPKEILQKEFLRHPIATIILLVLYSIALPYGLVEYRSGGVVSIFETIVYYAFIYFLLWCLVCWISGKIFREQNFQWRWYQKIIDAVFVAIPIVYRITFGVIIAVVLFYGLFILTTVVFKYSGHDLKILFS